MKFQVLFLLFLTTSCIDVCVQLTTYESCIGFDGEQCRWYGEYCRRSNNYLLGCDANLGIKLCVKQFGTLDGIVAECIFDNFCHKIYDKNAIHCTDKLSKSGCLSITNKNEFCKWEDGQCKNLSTNELSNIDTKFDQMELSASVCGQINGYLIIHNSILWNLINFIPDLYTEAENLVKIEAEIEVEIITNYDESAQLQDNYVDEFGNFVWYELTTLSSISNGRINDYTRYGCIAQEILTDSRFQMLFHADDLIRGVNHVYCSYLSTLYGYYIFINNECQKITELQLQDQNYIENLGIQCSQLSRIPCQRYLNKNEICDANKETEFGCTVLKQTSEIEQLLCEANVGLATHYYCAKIKTPCYLDVLSLNAQCSFHCNVQSETECLNRTGCQWLIKSNIIELPTNYNFYPCAPIDGCNQIGLSKSYCQQMAANCYWNETQTKCYSIDQIKDYKCADCNSIYCCSSVIQFDQYCIWQNDICLNIKDQNLFSHYLSFPTNVIMNKNLCVYQRGQYNYYNVISRTCETESFNKNQFCLINDVNGLDVDYVECDYPPNDTINLEACLALINSFTKWDYFTQKCLYVVNMNKPCNEMKLVNQNVCKFAVVQEGYLCLYDIDTLNCYSIKSDSIELTCETPGIDEEQCISLSEQNCQWLDNQCSKIQAYEIQQRFCYGLMKVSASVCKYPLNQEIQCQYDQDANGCSVIYSALNECNQYSNKYACQKSQESCYFNNILNQCMSSLDLLNIIQCDAEFISKTTCLSITTPGQRCIWNQYCQIYKQQFYSDCSDSTEFNDKYNKNVCEALSSNISLNLNDYQYCEYSDDTQQCIQQNTPITEAENCGYLKQINIFRCMGDTLGFCYFKNYKCQPLIDNEYKKILINSLTCDQSNMQLCNQIITPGQACYKVNQRKCMLLYTSFSDTCLNLASMDMGDYSPNLCIRAIDECYYNSDPSVLKCQVPADGEIFDCTQIGASQQLCLKKTKGACIFTQNYCKIFNDQQTSCEFRNKKACTMGILNCQWNDTSNSCVQSVDVCPDIYSSGVNYLVCQIGSDCYAGTDGCITDNSATDLPCWLSLSQTLCEYQQTFCQWIDNKCLDKIYSCENAQTFDECIFHTSLNCVYDNNKCFEITNISNHSCDEFDYTSLNFCRNYLPSCVYSSNIKNCSKINYFGQSKQRDTELHTYGCGSISATQNSCTLQRISSCMLTKSWYSDSCETSEYERTDCDYFSGEGKPSILFCEIVDQCKFGLTSLGEPFCYSNPFICEKVNIEWCLKDMSDALCFINADDACQTFTDDIGYDAILTFKVNYNLCVLINENDPTKQYYYQLSTNLCKYKNLELPLEISLNDCNQQTGSKYYDIQSQSCLDFDQSSNLDKIYHCLQLNQVSCIQLKNDMFCVWVQEKNKCLDFDIEYADLECTTKNYQSCLISNDDCIWKSDQEIPCQNASDVDVSSCPDCPKSEKYCISQSQLWNGEQCYDYNGDLPLSFFRCDNLGLDQNLCLNNTIDLFCYWDGIKCKQSNLKTQECEDTVSKQTCLNIKTKNQFCNWQNDSCVNVVNSQNCNDYLSLQNCRDSLISCEFNQGENQCQDQNENPQFCSNTLSYGACQKVEYQYCQWNQNQCQTWFRTRYSCQNIINYWGCLNTVMYCKWNDNKCEDIEIQDYEQPLMPCLDIPDNFNKVSCSKYSETSCKYDEQLKRCSINLTSEFTSSLETDQTNFVQIRLTNKCDELIKKEDCIGSRIGYCEWHLNACLNCQSNSCTQTGCANKSILQCLSMSNLFCAWRNDQCVDWIVKQDIDLQELSLVTEKCCSSIDKEIKYNFDIKSCQPLNLYLDDCSTPGLSENACLKIKNFQCTYKNGKCQTFDSGAKTSCDQYTKITQYVCMNLQHLSCKYDSENHKCIQLEKNDDCNVLGLSVLGCTTIQSTPCYWNSELNQCQDFIVNPGENQCDDFVKRNSISCSQLNYHLDVCSFNIEKRTCHQNFNEYSLCSFPGLNQLACSKLKIEPCIYKNNQCQKITNLYVSCAEMQQVNELACKLNMLDICSYDPIYHNCNFSLSQLPCNYQGINQNNCMNQEKCAWSYDNSQCMCQSETLSKKCQLELDECKTKDICVYDNEIQMCKLKTCSNLSKCEGKVNGYVCYLNVEQKCQNAQKCEDIINLDKKLNCEEFLFDFSNCISLSNNCISSKNLKEICVNSDCSNTSCKLDNSICRPLQCSDYSESECYYFSNCSLINNKCQYVQSCSEIEDNVVCVSTTVQGKRCSWEMYGIFENTKHCTNTYCYLYMASPSLCNGNEINQFSCYMDQFLQCRQCEEIVDRCTCENSKGACIYSEGQCKSVLCQSFLNENDCVLSNKCYWSSVDKVCRKSCKQLILEEECDALSYECHWNPYQYKCEQGIEVIPDLSVKIDVQDIQSLILEVMLIVFILLA